MKRIFSLLIAAVMLLLCLASCVGNTPTVPEPSVPGSSDPIAGPEIDMTEYEHHKKLYVDGSAPAGGSGSETAPFDTLSAAYDAAVAYINSTAADKDVLIVLADGKHELSETLLLDGGRITTGDDYSITLLGSLGGTRTVLSTTRDASLSDFVPVGDGVYEYQIPESAMKEGKYPAFRDLYIDGKPMVLATLPTNTYKMLFDSCANIDGTYQLKGVETSDRLLYVDPDAIAGVETDPFGNVIGTLEFWVQTDWKIECVRIEHIDWTPTRFVDDRADGTGNAMLAIRVNAGDWEVLSEVYKGSGDVDGTPATYYKTLKDRRYWLSNNLAYLDEEGEFWYDRENGKIYCAPADGAKTVSYPLDENILNLKDMNNLTIRNMDFFGSTQNYITNYGYLSGGGAYIKRDNVLFLPNGAIYGEDVNGLTVTECNIYSTGVDGINLRGAVENVKITDCRFTDIGCTAIRFGQKVATHTPEMHNENIVVRNNFVQNTGIVFNSAAAILTSTALNAEISHNTILDSSYAAIIIGNAQKDLRDDTDPNNSYINAKNVNIAYNYIENFMTKTQDGGAIYVSGGNANLLVTEQFNSMNNNYVVLTEATGNGRNQWTVFYHDNCASHWNDHDNVLVLAPGSLTPSYTYVSYQSRPQTYYNTTTNLYVIGYKNDADANGNFCADSAEATTVRGWYFMPLSVQEKGNDTEFVSTRDPETGAYSFSHSSMTEPQNLVYDVYIAKSFEEAEQQGFQSAAQAIADKAGCDSYRPTYGGFSAKK